MNTASRTTHRPWVSSEPSVRRVLKRDSQTRDETFSKSKDPSNRPGFQTSSAALLDSFVMSGQSTPAVGSFHVSPIPPATPKNSSKTALHDQHTLARACETLAMATTHKQQAPTTPRRCKPTHGYVTIKTRTSQETGFAALLCIQKGFISVVGGAELDDTVVIMPFSYAALKVVPGHDDVLELKIKTPDAKPNGIFLVVSDCSARDRWIEAFSAVGVTIEGHSGTLTMADSKPSSPWAPSHIRLTSETEFNLLCSKHDEPDRMPWKHEEQTRLRAHRNPRIRLTNEPEFDRLCSNDKTIGKPLKRKAQTRRRAIIEKLVDSKELLPITFILAVTMAHVILFVCCICLFFDSK
jgi:hypothetical protein